MSKMNARLSAVRPALLVVALLLTMIAMISPAVASCTPGEKRTIITNNECCGAPTPPKVTKQNQVCNSSGVWVSYGSPYCIFNSVCAN